MRHYFLPALLTCGMLAGWAVTASAQVTLVGTVQEDGTETAIVDARVEIFDRYNRRLAVRHTDAQGRFEARVRTEDGYRLRATRIGYREATTPILWTEGYDQIHVDIRLDPDAVLLAPLEVVARSRPTTSPVLESFWDRQRTGLGHFFTQADIDRRRPSQVTDLIATVPGIRLESGGRGTQRVIYMNRGTRSCQAQVYVDGFLLNRGARTGRELGFTLDDAVSPAAVVGIEVYSGLATVPAEFLSPEASCGVVVVWTRRGGPRGPGGPFSPDPEAGSTTPRE
jgi:hypothetical protein